MKMFSRSHRNDFLAARHIYELSAIAKACCMKGETVSTPLDKVGTQIWLRHT